MPFDMKDVRIEGYRDGSVHWHGTYRAIHLPTGLLVTFERAWNDGGKPRDEALAKLEEMTKESWRYPAPG